MIKGLGPGEQEFIALAASSEATLLLIDDRVGRRADAQLVLAVGGVTGVLIRAKQDGLIPADRPMLEEIRWNGSRLSVAVHSGLDGVIDNGVGAQKGIPRWLIIGPSHHGPLSAIPTAQGLSYPS